MSAIQTLKQYEMEFPELYKFAIKIINGEKVKDAIYNSIEMDRISSKSYNFYFRVVDNEIVAIGEERGRDGGWFWIKSSKE